MQVLEGRAWLRLDGRWRFRRDPEDSGLGAGWPERGLPEPSDTLRVPGVWNRAFPRYEGVAWYETAFDAADLGAGPAWLCVGAANQFAQFWLNGVFLGEHEGGYTPFALRCDQALRRAGPNRLVARLVDPPLEGEAGGLRLWETACAKETWYYRYGGIWGSVAVERRGPAWIEDAFLHATPDLRAARALVELAAEPGVPVARLRLDLVDPEGRRLGVAEQAVELGDGRALVELGLPVGTPIPWAPGQPARYRARLTLAAAEHREVAEVEFGLRYSELRDGRFFLNGRPLFLKGALVQPNEPLELVGPPDPSLLEREIEALAQGRFNLARVHLRPPAPGFLERADRAGLLVYVETALAWIRPHQRLLERGRREVEETIRLVRNHPSVALYGCFNENRFASAQVGHELLALGHALDPTRPIIDDSGGTAVDEGGGWHGQSFTWSPADLEPKPFNDLHLYFAAPLREQAERYLLELGRVRTFPLSVEGTREVGGRRSHELAPGAIFVSEFGYGGLPDLERVAAGFGAETQTVDAQDVIGYRDSLRQGVVSRGLEELFGGVAGLVQAAQQLQARGDARQAEALRLNPNVSGYVVTQLNDAAWELSAGLVDLWRQPKLALAALARVNASRVLVVRPERAAVAAGSILRLRAWLVDEQEGSRRGRLALELRAPAGQAVISEGWPVNGAGQIIPLGRFSLAVPKTPGWCQLRARLELEQEQLETEQPLLVLPDAPPSEGTGLQVLGDALQRRLPGAERWAERDLPLLAQADALAGRTLARAVEWTRGGGHLALVDLAQAEAERLAGALGLELAAHGTRGSFLGYFHYLRPHPLFAGLPLGVADEPFAEVLPAWSLRELPGAEIPAGVVTVGSARQWAWFADVQTLPFGRGRLTFYHYQPHRAPNDDPVAQALLRNLASWLSRG